MRYPSRATRNGNGGRARSCVSAARHCDDLQGLLPDPPPLDGVPTLQEVASASAGGGGAAERMARIDRLAQRCAEQAAMDFSFLYDSARDLLRDRL